MHNSVCCQSKKIDGWSIHQKTCYQTKKSNWLLFGQSNNFDVMGQNLQDSSLDLCGILSVHSSNFSKITYIVNELWTFWDILTSIKYAWLMDHKFVKLYEVVQTLNSYYTLNQVLHHYWFKGQVIWISSVISLWYNSGQTAPIFH